MATTTDVHQDEDDSGSVFTKNKPLIQVLIDAHRKDPELFTLKDVQDEFITATVASHHTLTVALLWAIYLLGLHSDVQETVLEEVNAKITDELSYDAQLDMPYLESVIKESLRLYTPIPAVARHLEKEERFGNYTIPRGTQIVFWIYSLHRDPTVFPNPEKFDPGRFAPGKKDQIGRFSYMPFGEGLRTCIGKTFSMMELKIVLSHIIQNFKVISLDPRDKINLNWSIVLSPVESPRIQLIPRAF